MTVCNPTLPTLLLGWAVMSRPLTAEELVGVAEIAERLGRTTSLVHDWRRRYESFPDPVAELRMGFVWAWPDVKAWARSTGRLD